MDLPQYIVDVTASLIKPNRTKPNLKMFALFCVILVEQIVANCSSNKLFRQKIFLIILYVAKYINKCLYGSCLITNF